eukprot:1156387-Pelagomonas_calceolata.AAC.1
MSKDGDALLYPVCNASVFCFSRFNASLPLLGHRRGHLRPGGLPIDKVSKVALLYPPMRAAEWKR